MPVAFRPWHKISRSEHAVRNANGLEFRHPSVLRLSLQPASCIVSPASSLTPHYHAALVYSHLVACIAHDQDSMGRRLAGALLRPELRDSHIKELGASSFLVSSLTPIVKVQHCLWQAVLFVVKAKLSLPEMQCRWLVHCLCI